MPPAKFRFFPSALVLAFLVAGEPAFAQTKVERNIEDIRVGFQGKVAPGCWIPISVDLTSRNDQLTGILRITVPDGDELSTTTDREVHIERNGQTTAHLHVKLGHAQAGIQAELFDDKGRKVAVRQIDGYDVARDALDSYDCLLVTYGSPSGVPQAAAEANEAHQGDTTRPGCYVAPILPARDLPEQWFGYESVASVLVATGDQNSLDALGRLRESALETWVRQGGHLVVSVASNWQLVASGFLGRMLPARPTTLVRVKDPRAIEDFSHPGGNVGERFHVGEQGLEVAALEDVRGRVLVRAGGRPLVVTGTYGLGKVTLLAFDTDRGPFTAWEGKRRFWVRLLGLDSLPAVPQPYTGTDAAMLLHQRLDDFAGVAVVPFQWVAGLIFLYILLIGPVDYFFLKKVVGRLELTWITFPSWVVAISVGAYYAAYWLKGEDLRINRVEVVDIDASSKSLRGTSFLSLFSPRIEEYTLAMEPGLGAAGSWADLGMGREQSDRLISWLAVPANPFGGAYGRGPTGLWGRRGYAYGSDARFLVDVPIQVWSVKTFTSHWLAEAGPLVEAKLVSHGIDADLSGTLTNVSDRALVDVEVCHGSFVYHMPRLGPKQEVDLAALRRQPATRHVVLPNQGDNTDAVARALLSPHRSDKGSAGRHLAALDLSDRLELGQVIVLAKVEDAEGGRLWLNFGNQLPQPDTQPPAIRGVMDTQTFVRVLIEPKEES